MRGLLWAVRVIITTMRPNPKVEEARAERVCHDDDDGLLLSL
jgi:hypothetical protein